MPTTYDEFFSAAFEDGRKPYDYQRRLAEETCASLLIDVPTGLGKTAAVVMAWLWNRVARQSPEWPRRLVYCLPMRTLVEQTRDEAVKWVGSHGLLWTKDEPRKEKVGVHILMGGEEADDWDLYPEENAILIGTQDMLLSRALNRGYGMSRYRWPMHFGLLNNDCLWVMDEVQLMGAGLASTTQLEGFRQAESGLGSRNCHSWWMSATIRPEWLKTVDFPDSLTESDPLRLTDEEKTDAGRVEALRNAPKKLAKATTASGDKNAKSVAEFIALHRSPEHPNLVVVNTVKRARALHDALTKQLGKQAPMPVLLHSQFRPQDRLRVLAAIGSVIPGQIVISTQVIEAGVDLSAHTLFTELAPWSSLVQRFGRCNRWLVDGRTQFSDARILWLDLDADKESAPYESEQLAAARERLASLGDASIANLETVASPEADRPKFRHVIRRKDLVELFDTTPDLAGADLDIDRFVRDADSSHVQVFWRNWSAKSPNGGGDMAIGPESAPLREELCSTSIGELRALLKNDKAGNGWRWNLLEREWQSVKGDALYPGQIYLLHCSQGGYAEGSPDTLPLGWTGVAKQSVSPLALAKQEAPFEIPEANEDDAASESADWQTLAQHTDQVCRALEFLLNAFQDDLPELPESVSTPLAEILRHAARWHDWGKAHPAFQAKLKAEYLAQARDKGHLPTDTAHSPAAKAPGGAWVKGIPRRPGLNEKHRRHFRHELASALGILHPDSGFPLEEAFARDLTAYLVAAHHGKVRLSIRSLPDEWIPPIDDRSLFERRFARGVWDNDRMDACDLGGAVTTRPVVLSLEPMGLGLGERDPFVDQPSWAERALNLRDLLGPFALSFLETLLRSADGRASIRRTKKTTYAPPGPSEPTMFREPSANFETSSLTPEQQALVAALVEDGLAIQDRFRPEPLYKHTGEGHFESRSVEEIRAAKEKGGSR